MKVYGRWQQVLKDLEGAYVEIAGKGVRRRAAQFLRVISTLVLAIGLLVPYAPVFAHDDTLKLPIAPENSKVYLPNVQVEGNQSAPDQKEPDPVEPGSGETCELNAQEQKIAKFMWDDPRQGRATMQCNPILAAVARERAQDMGERAYFSHINPDGEGPNFLVLKAGYELPSWYPSDRHVNNLESIGAGYGAAENVWEAWMKSAAHRQHILGENSFYAAQTEYGIGFAEVAGSPFEQYWVVITAPVP